VGTQRRRKLNFDDWVLNYTLSGTNITLSRVGVSISLLNVTILVIENLWLIKREKISSI
jgi:hypothetical protein